MSEALDNRKLARSDRAGRVARLKAERPAARGSKKKRSAKKTSSKSVVHNNSVDRPWLSVGLGIVLLGLCVAFGVQSATQSQRMRTLYSQLQQDTLAKDALLAQQSRLLIERGALKSYNSVDRLAEDKLKMRFPESITRVTREAGK